ncbi:MAG TPA: RIP metalloprotease RseP [Fibrobacteraceae bacterium]|jgi:regulator of sigma E protease|nr:RIP metalloprotease RseP [Fibrobacteraceae bacterium]
MDHYLQIVLTFILGLLGLSFLVFIHELGHFLVAKKNGVRVKTFSIGFGKKLLRYKKGETEYCISLIPFGGYVAMTGENPDNPDEIDEEGSFVSKSVGARAAIAFAGPFVNILFAFLLLIGLYIIGVEEPVSDQLIVGFVDKTGAAQEAGILPDDTIYSIDGKPVKGWDDFRERIGVSLGANVTLEVHRKDSIISLSVVPKELMIPKKDSSDEMISMGIGDIGIYPRHRVVIREAPVAGSNAYAAGIKMNDTILSINQQHISRYEDVIRIINASKLDPLHFQLLRGEDTLNTVVNATYNKEYDRYMIGIQMVYVMYKETHIVKSSVPEAIKKASATSWKMTTSIFRYFKKMFQGQVKADAFSGPVTIVAVMGSVWMSGFQDFLMLLALISINLGIMNLLPLAITDGGLLMFLAIEKVRGRPLARNTQLVIQNLAMAFFLSFFVFITFLDFNKLGLFLK